MWAVNDNPATNGYLVKIIGEQNSEYLYPDKLCADGKKRNLFRCPKGYENVQSAISAMKAFNLKFEVFKEDSEDVIVRYVLWKRAVQKSAKAMRLNKTLGKHHSRNARFKPV